MLSEEKTGDERSDDESESTEWSWTLIAELCPAVADLLCLVRTAHHMVLAGADEAGVLGGASSPCQPPLCQ